MRTADDVRNENAIALLQCDLRTAAALRVIEKRKARRAAMYADELCAAAQIVLEHAREMYLHFESARGQADLARLETAIQTIKEGPRS